MTRMSESTVQALHSAVSDPTVVARYRSHILTGTDDECHLWTGAISGRGHGRFYVASRQADTGRRRTVVVIAHRFGYAAAHGVDALLDVPVVGHRCDNPVCQNPRHWRDSNTRYNALEYARRRAVILSPLADLRGARGRAKAVRDAARDGADISAAMLAGVRPVHRDQAALF